MKGDGDKPNDAIVRAIARLTPRQQQILNLHRGEGLSYVEIADRLSISVGEIERHMAAIILAIHRARKPRREGVVQLLRRWLGLRR
jgi:RNA polymerase sigma factor (sigma-70 family)